MDCLSLAMVSQASANFNLLTLNVLELLGGKGRILLFLVVEEEIASEKKRQPRGSR